MDDLYTPQIIIGALFLAFIYFRSKPSKADKLADSKYKDAMRRHEACKVFGSPEYFEAMRQVKEDLGIDFKTVGKALFSKGDL